MLLVELNQREVRNVKKLTEEVLLLNYLFCFPFIYKTKQFVTAR